MKMCFLEICDCEGTPVVTIQASSIESVRYDFDEHISTVRTFSGDSFTAKGRLDKPLIETLLEVKLTDYEQDELSTFQIIALPPTVTIDRIESVKEMSLARMRRNEQRRDLLERQYQGGV